MRVVMTQCKIEPVDAENCKVLRADNVQFRMSHEFTYYGL